MKSIFAVAFVIMIFLAETETVFTQNAAAYKIAVLPISSNGIDSVSVQTIQSVLEVAVAKQANVEVITSMRVKELTNIEVCSDSKCAEEIGIKTGAARVLGCRLAALGNKIVVQYFILDVKTAKEVIIDQITAANIEDLQPVMERIAMSSAELVPVSQNAEVGKIYETESEVSLRRSSRKNVGLSFGYLYPQKGYDNFDKSFVVDVNLDYEIEDYAVGMQLAAHKGFAMNIYGDYLFSRKDVCPYVGGAFGFHWVSHNEPQVIYQYGTYYGQQTNKTTDGFELVLNTGLRILHTYNIQIVVNLAYTLSFNDYNDQAIVFTLGIL